MEDGVVSVDHVHLIFSIDEHHVPVEKQDASLASCKYKLTSFICVNRCDSNDYKKNH